METKLSKKVLDHIVTRHPEVAAYVHEIVKTAQDPDVVIMRLRGELSLKVLYPAPCRTEILSRCVFSP